MLISVTVEGDVIMWRASSAAVTIYRHISTSGLATTMPTMEHIRHREEGHHCERHSLPSNYSEFVVC